MWWWVETGVERNSRYTTLHYTLFPSSRCTARTSLSPHPIHNHQTTTPTIFLDLERSGTSTSLHFYNPGYLHQQLRLSRSSSLVQRGRPLLYISLFVRTANPPKSPSIPPSHQSAFASKVRAFETPALTTPQRSLTKLLVRT